MASKRNRPSLSCTFCKKRKIKCDRSQPCSNCVKKGRDDCVYENEGVKIEDGEMVLNEISMLKRKLRKLEENLSSGSGSRGDSLSGLSGANGTNGTDAVEERINDNIGPDKDSVDSVKDLTEVTMIPQIGSHPVLNMVPTLGPVPRSTSQVSQVSHPVSHTRQTAFTSPITSPTPIPSQSLPHSLPSHQSHTLPSASSEYVPRLLDVPADGSADESFADEYMGYNPHKSEQDIYESTKQRFAFKVEYNRHRANSSFSMMSMVRYDQDLLEVFKLLLSKAKDEKEDSTKPVLPESMKDIEKNYDEMLRDVFGRNENVPWKELLESQVKSKNGRKVGTHKSQEGKEGTKENGQNGQNGDRLSTQNPDSSSTSQDNTRSPNEKLGLTVTFIPKHKQDEVEEFIQTILKMLPPQNIIWQLVEIYFTKFNWLYPIFKKQDFKNRLFEITGPETMIEQKLTHLEVVKRMDFAVLGQLFMMLRIGSLALISNSYKSSDSRIKDELGSFAIGINFANMSSKCLDHFDIMKVSSIEVLSLMLMHRVYKLFAPEEGLRGLEQEHSNLDVLIINIANGLGINQPAVLDCSAFDMVYTENNYQHLWWVIYDIQLHHSSICGEKFKITDLDYSISRPKSESQNRALCTAESANFPGELTHNLIDILKVCATVSHDSKLASLTGNLDMLELKVLSGSSQFKKGFFFDISIDEISRCKSLRAYLLVINVELSILFSLYVYYAGKGDSFLCGYYIRKMIAVSFVKFFPVCHEILENGTQTFPIVGDFTLIPDVIILLSRATMILSSLIIRFEFIHRNTTSEGSKHATKSILKIMPSVIVTLTNILTSFGTKYFNAWIMAADYISIKECIVSGEVFEFAKDYKGFELDEKDLVLISDELTRCHNVLEKNANGIFSHTFMVDSQKQTTQKQTTQKTPGNIGPDTPRMNESLSSHLDFNMYDNLPNMMDISSFQFDDFYIDGFFRNLM